MTSTPRLQPVRRGLLLAAPRFDEGLEVRHEGPPVPSLPHVEMTVRMLRAAGAVRRRLATGGRPEPGWSAPGGSTAPVTVEPDLSNAAPFLAAALVTGGPVTVPDWPQDSLQAAGRDLDGCWPDGRQVARSARGLAVTGTGAGPRVDADLRDVGELAPVLGRAGRAGRLPSAFTGIAHTCAATRPTGWPRWPRRSTPRRRRRETARRSRDPAAAAAAAAVRHLRRPPDGDGRGRARAGRARRAGRGRRHGGQDAARTSSATVGRDARTARPGCRHERPAARPATARRGRRPGPPRRAARGRAPGRGPAHDDAVAGLRDQPSTAAAYGCRRADDGLVVRHEGARARPQGPSSSATGSALVGDTSGGDRTRWPGSSGSSRGRSVLRRYRRRHRPHRAGHRRQRRPAGDRHARWPTRRRGSGFIDRCLVAAYDGGLDPLLVLTKADLRVRRGELLRLYAPLGLPMLTTGGRWRRATLSRAAARLPAGSACWSGSPAWASRRW